MGEEYLNIMLCVGYDGHDIGLNVGDDSDRVVPVVEYVNDS